ncbi:MAG: glycosyltransferase family 4 protein [bacterium]
MKVLFIHNAYGKYSGEEAVVNAQIDLLKSSGIEVCTYFRSSEEIPKQKFGKVNAFFSALYGHKSILEIKEVIINEMPDIVHVHNLYPFISPAVLPEIKKLGVPVVMTMHNYRVLCPNGLFYTKGKICEKCTGATKELNCITNNCEGSLFKSTGYALRNFWARNKKYYHNYVDKYFCLTEFQKQKLIANGYEASKCVVIPNMFEKSISEIDYNPSNRKYIAFAGRLSPEKGISLLIETAKKLPHIPFHLAGQMREGFDKIYQFPKNVKHLGMLSKDEIYDFYKQAKLYLHTSLCYEGFPMVFPEAMAFKLPILAPNIGGYPEVSEHKHNGMLYNFNDSDHLAETIEQVWNDETLLKNMAENGYQKLKHNYTKENYKQNLINQYNRILN